MYYQRIKCLLFEMICYNQYLIFLKLMLNVASYDAAEAADHELSTFNETSDLGQLFSLESLMLDGLISFIRSIFSAGFKILFINEDKNFL